METDIDAGGGGSEPAEQPRAFKLETRASTIKFDTVCQALECAKNAEALNAKVRCLLTREIREIVGKESAYPYLRLLLPQNDTSTRGQYNIKEKRAAKLLVEKLGLSGMEAGERLLRFADSSCNRTFTGDFAATLADVLGPRAFPGRRSAAATVGEINQRLDRLARARADAERAACVYRAVTDLSPRQVKWIVRIIFQDLKIGVKADALFAHIHEDMAEEFSRTNNLRHVCSVFAGIRPGERRQGMIQVGVPFKPMLADPFRDKVETIGRSSGGGAGLGCGRKGGGSIGSGGGSSGGSCVIMGGRPFIADMKIDGERMLCHKDGYAVKWLTRRTTDYSEQYGPALTPWVLKNVKAERCILDGEVAAWDDDRGCLLDFGLNRRHAKEETDGGGGAFGSGGGTMFFIVFDCCYAEGEGVPAAIRAATVDAEADFGIRPADDALLPRLLRSQGGALTELPLAVRRGVLKALVTEERHRLETVHHCIVASRDPEERRHQLLEYFDTAVEKRGEGLVVKNMASPYRLGERSRRTREWVKMKPDTMGQTKDLDVCIVGAYHGKGSFRSGMLSQFLVAVKRRPPGADLAGAGGLGGGTGGGLAGGGGSGSFGEEDLDMGLPPEFLTAGRVGIGYSAKELEELNRRTAGKWRLFRKGDPTPRYLVSRGGKPFRLTGKDVDGLHLIRPEDSFVLQVRIAGVVEGRENGACVALRFPRVQRIRYDKEYYEVDDEAAVRRIVSDGIQRRIDASGGRDRGGGGGGDGEGGRKRGAGGGRREGAEDGDAGGSDESGDEGDADLDSGYGGGDKVAAEETSNDKQGGDTGRGGGSGGGGGGGKGEQARRRRSPCKRLRAGAAAPSALTDTSGVEVIGSAFSWASVPLDFCVLPAREFKLEPCHHWSGGGGGGGGDGGSGSGDVGGGDGGSGGGDMGGGDGGSGSGDMGDGDGGGSDDGKLTYTKAELDKMIFEQGGTPLASPTPSVFAVIASPRLNERSRNIITSGQFNVVHFAWLVDCHRRNAFREPTFSEYLAMDEKTKERMLRSHDTFGDHLTEPITPRELKALLDRMPYRSRDGGGAGGGGKSVGGGGGGGGKSVGGNGGGSGGKSSGGGGDTSGGGKSGGGGRSDGDVSDGDRSGGGRSHGSGSHTGEDGLDADSFREEPHWRQLLAALDGDEQPHFVLPTFFFWPGGAVFYVDQFTDLGSPVPLPSAAAASAAADAYWEPANQQGCVQTAAMWAAAVRIEAYGGALSRSLHAGVTHVIVDRRDMRRARMLWERLEKLREKREEMVAEKEEPLPPTATAAAVPPSPAAAALAGAGLTKAAQVAAESAKAPASEAELAAAAGSVAAVAGAQVVGLAATEGAVAGAPAAGEAESAGREPLLVDVSWIDYCVEAGRILEPLPEHLVLL